MNTTTGGLRCHNPEACCAGQKPCPSPTACGVEADALELADALDNVARNVVSDRATIQRAAEALRQQHAALSATASASQANLACAPIPGNFCNWVLKHPTPARDEDGMCVHSALMQTDDEANVLLLLAAYGIRGALVGMEDDAPALYEAYSESGNADCSAWTPTPPAGDGWLLLGVWDTEDGPYALFGREEYSIAKSVLVQHEPNIDLANLLTGYDLRDGGLSPRDRGSIERQARKKWRNILAAARKAQPNEKGFFA